MSAKKTQSKNPLNLLKLGKYKRASLLTSLGVIALLALFSLSLATYSMRYKGKIYPHTFIGKVDFGGKSQSEAELLLATQASALPKELTLSVNKQAIGSLDLKEINPQFNTKETAAILYKVGRHPSLLKSLRELTNSLLNRNERQAQVSFDQTKADQALEKITQQYGDKAQDAKIVLQEDNTPAIAPAKEGVGITVRQLDMNLRQSLSELSPTLNVTSGVIKPKITDEQVTYALEQTKAILAKSPLTLTAEQVTQTVDAKTLFSWLTYSMKAKKDIAPSATPLSELPWRSVDIAKAREKDILVTSFNQELLTTYLNGIGTGLNREAHNVELDVVDGKIKVTKDHIDGQKLKVSEAITDLTNKLTATDTTGSLLLALPIEKVAAQVRSDNIEAMGLKELVGKAETNFKGSPANRTHNINNGAKLLDGKLVAPGAEFSTIQTLGQIDGSTGYLPELVIKDNRTIPEFGGGLCQVSTTLFRSVMNAGLKVTERRNHSYRVSYYEPPVGLDATIYFPKPDFRFLNDTPGFILVQSRIKGTIITFELYGTNDGRTSSISDPVVTDVTEPPEALYTDTDTLNKGETKQIEKAHPGATAEATYVVTRDGKEINRQVFKSKYKAWQAQYLVGTKEAPQPSPTPQP